MPNMSTKTGGFNEAAYESAILLLLENLGYTRLYSPDIERDHHNPLYMEVFAEQMTRINRSAHRAAIEEAIYKITHIEHGTLIQQNKMFTDWLQNGVDVSYQNRGETKTDIIKLIDYDNLANNTFHVINQWTLVETETKRPDVVVFVNRLPLVVAELKSFMREDTDILSGYRQIRNYMKDIPGIFIYNAFCIISDLTETRVGTVSSGFDRFVAWKTITGDYEETKYAQYNVLFEGMLAPNRFLDILRHFILFSHDTPDDIKILAAYHQYLAVKKAIDSNRCAAGYTQRDTKVKQFKKQRDMYDGMIAADAPPPPYGKGDGKGGVFWHTQGSEKSLSMVFYAALLNRTMESPTIIVITDRNDLDNQLYEQFAACKDFLRQTPEQAESRKHLRDLLNERKANGIFFTTMQKFEAPQGQSSEPLSNRHNIVVIADEAHRSQYGLIEKVNKKSPQQAAGY